MAEAALSSADAGRAALRAWLRAPLDWTADPPGSSPARHLVAFRSLLLAQWVVQNWAWVIRPLPDFAAFPTLPLLLSAVLLSALLPLSMWRGGRFGRLACAVATPIVGWQVVWMFPFTPNHSGLLFLVLALCAFLEAEREEEGALLLQCLRWMTALVFFYAGLQKAIHGLYFQGEFLGWMVGHGIDRWAEIFGWVIPAQELERLQSFGRHELGAGPYRVDSVLFLMASNIVWIGEIAIGLGILLPRVRHWAALAAIAMTFTIQLAPREFMFAFGYTTLLLLSVNGEWNRRLLFLFLFLYAWLLAALLGAPGSFLLKAGGSV